LWGCKTLCCGKCVLIKLIQIIEDVKIFQKSTATILHKQFHEFQDTATPKATCSERPLRVSDRDSKRCEIALKRRSSQPRSDLTLRPMRHFHVRPAAILGDFRSYGSHLRWLVWGHWRVKGTLRGVQSSKNLSWLPPDNFETCKMLRSCEKYKIQKTNN